MITPRSLSAHASPVIPPTANDHAPAIAVASDDIAADHQPPTSTSSSDTALPTLPDTILRFLVAERLLHWAIAIPFLGCFVSALVLLVVYNHNPTGAYRIVFAWMHRGCGAALILCPSLIVLASGRQLRIHLYNIRQAWIWRVDDIKWLALMGPAALFQRIALPEQGKFNAAEKLNFMMVMVFPPLFITTGLLIWFPEVTALGAFGAWLIHCALAGLAAPLVIGHIIMATVNPSTRVGLMGMISGFVSREWAAHHYARWFREQFPDLAHEHANTPSLDTVGEKTNAGDELRPDAAPADRRPATAAQPLPVLAGQASVGSAVLSDAVVHAASAPSGSGGAPHYSPLPFAARSSE